LNRGFSFNWGGDEEFVMDTRAKLGANKIGRRVWENNEGYAIDMSFWNPNASFEEKIP
jgi:hypothetical protein